jgi:hypothetical protein
VSGAVDRFFINPAAYLADTSRFRAVEHGAYLLLVMDAYRHGSIPSDDRTVARIARLPVQHWRQIAGTVLSFFTPTKDGTGYVLASTHTAVRPPAIGRLMDVPAGEWAKLRQEVFERDGFACTYCGAIDDLECDHVVALAAGGKSHRDNLTAACRPCNASKGAKPLADWRGRA